MDNTPIYGCSGCATSGGRMACGIHGPTPMIVTPNPTIIAQLQGEVRLAVLAERDRCRKVATEHPWKCQGKSCDCARVIAHDIMEGGT